MATDSFRTVKTYSRKLLFGSLWLVGVLGLVLSVGFAPPAWTEHKSAPPDRTHSSSHATVSAAENTAFATEPIGVDHAAVSWQNLPVEPEIDQF
jgi:hypothetical protein